MTVTANVRHAPQSREEKSFDLILVTAAAATTTFGLGLVDRVFAVKKLEIISPSTYAVDPANYYTIDVRPHGGSALITWSTLTGADGALTANVVSSKVSTAGPQAAGQIDVVCTKVSSAANLPAQLKVRVTVILL